MSDLISREEVLKMLEEKRVQLNGSATMDMLIEKISNIPSQNEWISVEERLPQEEELVLVFIPTNRFHKVNTGRLSETGYWRCGMGNLSLQYPTHWQPLPLPPLLDK